MAEILRSLRPWNFISKGSARQKPDIIDGYVDSKDVVSLVIYWANQGYLSIKEEKNEEFILIKLKELPGTAKTYEHTMFYGLFHNRYQCQ